VLATTGAFIPSLDGLLGVGQPRPLHSRLPGAAYFAVPAGLKRAARGLVMRRRGDAGELVAAYLGRLAAAPPTAGAASPLLITHDVDTAEGFAALPRLLEVEAELGMPSLSLLVTHRYPWARAEIRGWLADGFIFGVHDTTHDNRLAYLPPSGVRERLECALDALGDVGSPVFRAPGLLRSPALYQGIAGVIDVDLSAPDWALAWPTPGDGVGTPFPVRHGGVTCLPTTLPRDGELLGLGLGDDVVVSKARQLAAIGAPIVLLTHPDSGFTHGAERVAAYRRLLETLRGIARVEQPAAVLEKVKQGAVEL
jgi:hypothetical protein